MTTANGTFEIDMTPTDSGLGERVGHFTFTKTFLGDLAATGAGIMLSAGDPANGSAGYVALETVSGSLNGVDGSFALQQFGTMHGGEQALQIAVVPGSGHGALDGITGVFNLPVDDDGTHRYELVYEI